MIKNYLEAFVISVSITNLYVLFASSQLAVDSTNTFDVVPIESIEFLDEKLFYTLGSHKD
jgi:hypothetical protein